MKSTTSANLRQNGNGTVTLWPKADRDDAAMRARTVGTPGRNVGMTTATPPSAWEQRALGFGTDFNIFQSFASGPNDLFGSESEVLVDPHRQIPRIYSCTKRISEALSSVRLKVFDGDDELDPDGDNALVRLLNDVNPLDSFIDTQYQLGQNLSLTGEHFLFLADGDAQPVHHRAEGPTGLIDLPAAIWPVMGGRSRVRAVPNPETGAILGWSVPSSSGQRFFPASTVILIKYRDPSNPFRGLGPLQAAMTVANQVYTARRYQSRLLQNSGDPGGWIETPELLGDIEYRRLSDEIDQTWNNPERAGEVRLLEGGAAYKNNKGGSPRDMQYQQLLAMSVKEIAEAFGVPDALLGEGTTNFATFKGELRVFWTLTIIPILQLFEDALNTRFIPRLTDAKLRKLRVGFDLSTVEALQGDSEDIEKAKGLTEIGMPANQALEVAGITADDIEGGDIPLIAAGKVRLDRAGESEDETDPSPTESEPDPDESDVGPDPEANVEGDKAAAPQLTLNGAQIASLLSIVEQVSTGKLSVDTAVQIIVAAFPFDEGRARRILRDVEEDSQEEPAPPPVPVPPLPPAEPGEGDDEAEEAPVPDDAKQLVAALAANGVGVKSWEGYVSREGPQIGDTREGRAAAWKQIQEPMTSEERRLERGVRRVFSAMRSRQIRVLKELAEEGFDSARAVNPVYEGDAPTVTGRGLQQLIQATELDAREARRKGLDKPKVEKAACGCERKAFTPHAPRTKRWLDRRPRAAKAGLSRLLDLAYLARAEISEAEIDQIVVALDEDFIEELERIFAQSMERASSTADSAIIAHLGPSFVEGSNAALVQAFRDKAIEVAEGVSSTVARRLRTAIIRTLAESNGIGTLQDVIMAAIGDLTKEVGRQFNMNARRARTIARTEIGQVSGMVRNQRLTEAEGQGVIVGRVWLTSVPASAAPPYEAGGFVRSQHHQMDGTFRPAGVDRWTMPDGSTLRHVRDPGGAAHQIINCRCQEDTRFPEDIEDTLESET